MNEIEFLAHLQGITPEQLLSDRADQEAGVAAWGQRIPESLDPKHRWAGGSLLKHHMKPLGTAASLHASCHGNWPSSQGWMHLGPTVKFGPQSPTG